MIQGGMGVRDPSCEWYPSVHCAFVRACDVHVTDDGVPMLYVGVYVRTYVNVVIVIWRELVKMREMEG